MTLREAIKQELPNFLDVYSEQFREDDDEPVRYIVDSSDFDPDAFADAVEAAMKAKEKIDPLVEHVARAIHNAMGNGWAYRNYGGDEWNDCRDTLMDAASAAIDAVRSSTR